METGLILAAFGIMTAIIVFFIQGNFTDLKVGQKEIKDYIETNMVSNKTCDLQRRACVGKSEGD